MVSDSGHALQNLVSHPRVIRNHEFYKNAGRSLRRNGSHFGQARKRDMPVVLQPPIICWLRPGQTGKPSILIEVIQPSRVVQLLKEEQQIGSLGIDESFQRLLVRISPRMTSATFLQRGASRPAWIGSPWQAGWATATMDAPQCWFTATSAKATATSSQGKCHCCLAPRCIPYPLQSEI